MRFIPLYLLVFISVQLSAQSDSALKNRNDSKADSQVESLIQKAWGNPQQVEGKLMIQQDDRLEVLIDGYKDQKTNVGFKVQIYSGRSRNEAIKEKSNFHSKYGNKEKAYLIYQPPNFKIRIGNYQDRLKATQALELYKIDFPSAFMVRDEIELPEN